MAELYPEIEPFNSEYLKVSNLHTVYYEQVGNPKGQPVIFIHGGPGGGLSEYYRQFFDPEYYHVILFDQRGCGNSTPFAELKENTTWDLIKDMEQIREKLGIDKWLLFGGSWGSTLALVYAVMHPERVTGMILRGIYLGQRYETYWLYQPEGAARLYPDEFEKYMSILNEDEYDNTVQAYYNRLTSTDEKVRNEAALIWSVWEGTISKLIPDPDLISDFGDPKKAVALSVLECTYFLKDLFFEYPDWLIDRVHELKDIPTIIVQGRYDIVCPTVAAWELKKRIPQADLRIIKDAGHNMGEHGIKSELAQATEDFKNIL